MQRNIIAISGGGFSEEENAYIDEYIIRQVHTSSSVRICFIPTASGDAKGYIEKFYNAFSNHQPSHLTVMDLQSDDIQELVNSFDVLYVGGGNTYHMLSKWRDTGFDQVLKNAYEDGVILAGISAGAMCWFDTCYSEGIDGTYEAFEGLGLLKGSLCPHYNDIDYKKVVDEWSSLQQNKPIYKLEDDGNLHFRNERCIAKIIT